MLQRGTAFMGSTLGCFFPVGLGDCQARSPLCFKHAASPERQLRPCNTCPKCRNIPSCDALGQQTQAQPFSRTSNHPNTPWSSPDAQRHVHQHKGIETALQAAPARFPAPNLLMKLETLGLTKMRGGGQASAETPCCLLSLSLELLGSAGAPVPPPAPRLPHSCRQTV